MNRHSFPIPFSEKLRLAAQTGSAWAAPNVAKTLRFAPFSAPPNLTVSHGRAIQLAKQRLHLTATACLRLTQPRRFTP